MRVAWILLAFLALATLGWLLGGTPGVERVDQAEPPPSQDAAGPSLFGSDADVVAEHRRRREDRAAALRDAQRGSGRGGFLGPDDVAEEGAAITGRILDTAGRPVSDGLVCVTDGDEQQGHAWIEKDGRFTLDVPADVALRVAVTTPGHVPIVLPWRRYGAGEHLDLGTLRLDRGRRIAGRVVDAQGLPHSAVVSIVPDDDPVPPWWRDALACEGEFKALHQTSAGRFSIEGLPDGRYRLHVDVGDDRDAVVLEGVPAGRSDLEVVVQPAHPEPETWDATLRLQSPVGPLRSSDLAVYFEGGRGPCTWSTRGDVVELRLSGPGPVHARLVFKRVGLMPAVVTGLQPPGGTRTVVLRVGHVLRGTVSGVPAGQWKGHSVLLAGRLREDGSLVPAGESGAATYGHYNQGARLDAAGRFEMRGLPPGTGVVSLIGRAVALAEQSVRVRTTSGQVRLEAAPNRSLDVEIGLPADARVEALLMEWRTTKGLGRAPVLHGRVDEQGGLLRTRVWMGRGLVDPELVVRTLGPVPLGPVGVRIPAGAQQVRVTLPAPQLVAGRVVDTRGRPVPKARVELKSGAGAAVFEPEDDSRFHGETVRPEAVLADLEGRFTVALPPEGRWRLFVVAAGLCMRDEPPILERGGEPRVVMQPALRITGRLRGPPQVFLDGFVVVAWPRAGGAAVRALAGDNGFFEIEALAEGTYTLVAHPSTDPGEDGTRQHFQALVPTVRAGARGVEVELEPGLAANLELVDEGGKRFANARAFLRGGYRDETLWNRGGRFALHGLRPGRYRFDVEVPGKGTITVPVEAGQSVRYVVR